MAEKENIQIFEVNLEAVQQPDAYDAELNVELPQNVEANMQPEIPEITVIESDIKSISKNGVELPVDENGNVDIIVPTKVSELDNDEGFVSESDLAEVATTGDYNDLSNQPDIESIAGNVSASAVSAHNESEEAHSDIRGEISTVKSIAEGANIAIVFSNYSELVNFFNSESDSLKTGTNLYVRTLDVPDLWISSVESTSVAYTYTTDEDFLAYINGNGQIGYYKFSELETQKVDLSNYATLTDLGTKVSKSGDTMTGGLLFDVATAYKWIGVRRPSGDPGYRDCIFWSANGSGTYFGQTNTNYDGIQTTFARISNSGLILNGTRGVFENNSTTVENQLQRYDKIFTTGIISDTKTWTEQADGSYSYVVSNPQSGPIPNSFITEWNTKAGLYGRQTLPRAFNTTTGYFELNGLSDITYEEAIVILAESTQLTMQANNYPKSRTNLGIRLNSASISRQWQASNSEVAYWANTSWSLGATTSSTTFLYSCPHLRAIIYSRWSSIQGNLTITDCPSLTTIEVTGTTTGPAGNLNLTGAPNLSLQSIVGMVNSAQNTAAKTYTVAGNTWTACQNDTTQYTYSGQTYTGIISYAAARNLTITN